MKEIQEESTLVQISARFDLSGAPTQRGAWIRSKLSETYIVQGTVPYPLKGYPRFGQETSKSFSLQCLWAQKVITHTLHRDSLVTQHSVCHELLTAKKQKSLFPGIHYLLPQHKDTARDNTCNRFLHSKTWSNHIFPVIFAT